MTEVMCVPFVLVWAYKSTPFWKEF